MLKLRTLFSLAMVFAIVLAVGCSSDSGTNPMADTGIAQDSNPGKDRALTPDAVGTVEGDDASAKRKDKSKDSDDESGDAGEFDWDDIEDVDGLLERVSLQDIKKLKTEEIEAEDGGKISVGKVKLTIPPGALGEDTEISIVVLYGDDGDVDFELLPHGITFNVPVTLEVNFNKMYTKKDDVRQFWLDETTSDWVDVGGTWKYPTMTTEIDHFSRWRAGRVGW